MGSQMVNLRLYHRFSVSRGLEVLSPNNEITYQNIVTQTSVYLDDLSLSEKVDQCSELLRIRDGTASLEQLSGWHTSASKSFAYHLSVHSGGEVVLAPPLPPLTKTFVMRQEPWAFIEKTMLGVEDEEVPRRQKMLLVTGMGGCGKTRLILKFIEVHGDK